MDKNTIEFILVSTQPLTVLEERLSQACADGWEVRPHTRFLVPVKHRYHVRLKDAREVPALLATLRQVA